MCAPKTTLFLFLFCTISLLCNLTIKDLIYYIYLVRRSGFKATTSHLLVYMINKANVLPKIYQFSLCELKTITLILELLKRKIYIKLDIVCINFTKIVLVVNNLNIKNCFANKNINDWNH